MSRRSIAAASFPSTSGSSRSRRRCSGGSWPTRWPGFPPISTMCCPTPCARRCRCRRDRQALADAHFPPPTHAARRAQRVSIASAAAPDPRRVLSLPGRPAAAAPRSRARAEDAGHARGRHGPRLAQARAAVPSDAGTAARAEGHRRGHAEAQADEPAAAGRRRIREDDRRRARGAAGDGERPAGGLHGADRAAGRAALPHDSTAAGRDALQGGAADRHGLGRVAQGAPRADWRRPHRSGRRHARDRAGRREVQGDWAGGRGRAASLRRAAARHAAREGPAARHARDDGDADSAHAGADDLRRSRRVEHSRAAAGAPAGPDRLRSPIHDATRSTPTSGPSSRRGARSTSSIRSSRSRRRSTSAPRPRWPTISPTRSFPRIASRCCMDG